MIDVKVTQADRDARQEWRKNGYTCEGAWLLLDQAFARHRIEATRQLEADKAELVEALRFYADEEMYCRHKDAVSPVEMDEGRTARAALAKHGGNHD